jgi:endo-1,4-beta-mannosidase
VIKQYRKKPVVIEAVQWTGDNRSEIFAFAGKFAVWGDVSGMIIKTLEGQHIASVGDYIIKGVNGEFYPCKPEIFEKTYDLE